MIVIMNLYIVSFVTESGEQLQVYVAAVSIAKAIKAAELNVDSAATGVTKLAESSHFIIVHAAAQSEELK